MMGYDGTCVPACLFDSLTLDEDYAQLNAWFIHFQIFWLLVDRFKPLDDFVQCFPFQRPWAQVLWLWPARDPSMKLIVPWKKRDEVRIKASWWSIESVQKQAITITMYHNHPDWLLSNLNLRVFLCFSLLEPLDFLPPLGVVMLFPTSVASGKVAFGPCFDPILKAFDTSLLHYFLINWICGPRMPDMQGWFGNCWSLQRQAQEA